MEIETGLSEMTAYLPVKFPKGWNHSGYHNIVIDNKTGLLCEERDIEALTCNLENLICNRHLRDNLGEAARINATEKFSIQKQVETLNGIYTSLI